MPAKKYEMTTLNWVFLTIILALVQAFIWYAAFENASSSSALNYVSFSGTLISIILAVLAIGYTYGESVSEKNKGDNLSSQINVLEEVIKSIKSETEHLENISDISDNLIKLRDELENKINTTNRQVMGLHDSMNNIMESFTGVGKKSRSENDATYLPDDVLNILGVEDYDIQSLVVSLVCSVIKKKRIKDLTSLVSSSVDIILNPDAKDEDESIKDLYLMLGGVASTFIALEGSGMIYKNDKGLYEIDEVLENTVFDVVMKDFDSKNDEFNFVMDNINKMMN